MQRRQRSVSQSNGAMDCYVTVKGLSVGQRTACENKAHSSQWLLGGKSLSFVKVHPVGEA
eukprot:5581480-Prymnesium_polylepis.1